MLSHFIRFFFYCFHVLRQGSLVEVIGIVEAVFDFTIIVDNIDAIIQIAILKSIFHTHTHIMIAFEREKISLRFVFLLKEFWVYYIIVAPLIWHRSEQKTGFTIENISAMSNENFFLLIYSSENRPLYLVSCMFWMVLIVIKEKTFYLMLKVWKYLKLH